VARNVSRVIFLTVIVAVLAVARRLWRPGNGNNSGAEGQTGPTGTTPEATGRVPTIDPASIDWLVVGLGIVAALVGFAILAAVLVRPKGRSMPELEARKELERLLDETLDDLPASGKTGVITACVMGARLLEADPRGAVEYLGRVLAELAAARRSFTYRPFERAVQRAID
jgi:hypothetical protein